MTFDTHEGENFMFPTPVFESCEVEERSLIVMAVTIFFTLANEASIVVSLFQASPSKGTSGVV
jgi:hypothetical protein